jgi:2'-5' RNA ligase
MNGPAARAGEERVGVVVPIPEPHAARLAGLRLAAGDPLGAVPPHLTLLTGLPVTDWNQIVEHVAAVAAGTEPTTLRFSGTATFRPLTPVVYCPLSVGERWCLKLHAALRAGPLAAPSAYPFVPHVTLGQGLDDAALDTLEASQAGVTWDLHADRVALYGDLGDADWKLRATFPLGTP